MQPTETQRTFSQEQAQAMYEIVRELTQILLPKGRATMLRSRAYRLLQALDSDTAAPTDGGEARYRVKQSIMGDWMVVDTKKARYYRAVSHHVTEAEARAEADRLNAAQTGGEG